MSSPVTMPLLTLQFSDCMSNSSSSACFDRQMNRKNANHIKIKFSSEHQYQEALKILNQHQLNDALTLLNSIQDALETSISDYALELTHDLLDEETPQIVRTFWFSKGLQDYYFCIDGTGLIRALEDAMPDRLFDQIMSTLDPFYA